MTSLTIPFSVSLTSYQMIPYWTGFFPHEENRKKWSRFYYTKTLNACASVYLYRLMRFESVFSMAQYPLVGQGFLVIQASRSHSDTTLGRTPLDEWSARRRDPYLITHNTHKRQISMHPAGFEPAIPTSERPQTHDIDSRATGIGIEPNYRI